MWVWGALELAGIVGLAALGWLGKGWTGRPAIIVLVAVTFLTLVGAVASRVHKWFSNRLQVRVEIELPKQSLPVARPGKQIEAWLEHRRDLCLKPLRDIRERAERERQRNEAPVSGFRIVHPSALVDLSGMMAALAATQSLVGQIYGAQGNRPENREPEEYEREVSEYLARAQVSLTDLLVCRYVSSQRGLLRLRPVNKTDRTFKDVKFVLRLPPWVSVIDSDKLEKPKPLPRAPRAYGTREPPEPILMPGLGIIRESLRPSLLKLGSGVDITSTSSGPVVKYPSVTLRAKDHEGVLPDLHLLVGQDGIPGSLTIQWEATADNAEGRVSGQLRLTIGEEDLAVEDLLHDVLAESEQPASAPE
jgi:hypothetical protein